MTAPHFSDEEAETRGGGWPKIAVKLLEMRQGRTGLPAQPLPLRVPPTRGVVVAQL